MFESRIELALVSLFLNRVAYFTILWLIITKQAQKRRLSFVIPRINITCNLFLQFFFLPFFFFSSFLTLFVICPPYLAGFAYALGSCYWYFALVLCKFFFLALIWFQCLSYLVLFVQLLLLFEIIRNNKKRSKQQLIVQNDFFFFFCIPNLPCQP